MVRGRVEGLRMIDETLALVHEKLQLFVDGLNTPETDPITE